MSDNKDNKDNKDKKEPKIYVHYSNTQDVLVNIYSYFYEVKFDNPYSEKIEYTIYIGEPYFIHILINKNGLCNYYRSTEKLSDTKEGYFNELNLNKKISKNFYCKIIDVYNLLNDNLFNHNQINGFEIMDLFTFYSSYKKINKYFTKKKLDEINYNMNALILKIPTFEQLYGFTNIVVDDSNYYEILDKIIND